jgi:hypothetical protein
MELTIPLPSSDQPYTEQSVSLDGRTYVFAFNWNSRSDRWSMSIATEDGDPIITGAVLVMNIDLLRTIPSTLDYVPPGQIYLGGDGDPTLDTISNVTLFYIEAV